MKCLKLKPAAKIAETDAGAELGQIWIGPKIGNIGYNVDSQHLTT